MLDSQVRDSHSVHGAESELNLAARIGECRGRARDIGQAVLLRVHLALPAHDPWLILSDLDLSTTEFFAWNDGRHDLRFVGYGEGIERGFSASPNPFGEAQRFCGQLLEQVDDFAFDGQARAPIDVPLALGGFAFDGQEPSTAHDASCPWQGWPAGLLYVPHVLVYDAIGQNRAGVIVSLLVHPDTDSAKAVRDVVQTISRVKRRLAHPPAAAKATLAGLGSPVSHTQLQIASLETKAEWCERVKIASSLSSGSSIIKVVLSRAADFTLPTQLQFDALAMLGALRQSHPSSTCFAFGRRGHGCFLGATPETLVAVSGRSISTSALAGTSPRGGTDDHDARLGQALVESAKNRHEHGVVAHSLEKALKPLCAELTVAETPHLVRLPRVQHLETPLHGVLRRAGGILELVERLHPTPSVGGWPEDEAQKWLHTHETLDRGWYAGPIGWLTAAGDGTFAVAIRSVLLKGQVARAFAGAGIVRDSDPESEWQETEWKLRTVVDALRIRDA